MPRTIAAPAVRLVVFVLILLGLSLSFRLFTGLPHQAAAQEADTPTATASAVVTATMAVTPTASATLTPTVAVSPTATATLAPAPSPTVTLTLTPTLTATPVPTVSATPVVTVTPTATATPPLTTTVTVTPTATATLTPTVTPTITPTATITPTVTPAPTAVIEPGPPALIQIGVKPADETADRSEASPWIAVYVVDAEGWAVADGTEVTLNLQGGRLEQDRLQTKDGLVTTRFRAPRSQAVTISAQAGSVQATLTWPESDSANSPRLEHKTEDKRYGEQVAAMVRARNAVRGSGSDFSAENPSRRVNFDQGQMTFRLKRQGSDLRNEDSRLPAEERLDVGFRLTGLSVGRESLLGRKVTMAATDNWVTYQDENDLWQMAYQVGDAAVEQYFIFEKGMPVDGDLVIEGRFQTSLQPVFVSAEEGIRFVSPRAKDEGEEGVGYGPALVTDAGGRRFTARMELNRKQVRITVPAGWLAAAEFPVTVDPVIGPAELVGGLQGEAATPEVATDGTNFLTVWEWNGDIYGQLVDATGTLSGSLITISQAEGTQHLPDVSYNSTTDEYLVIWDDHRYGWTYNSLQGQRLSPAGQLLGSEIEIQAPQKYLGSQNVAVSAAGDYLVVWSDSGSTNGYNIYGQLVNGSGVVSGTRIEISTASGTQSYSDVAYDSAADVFLAVWGDNRSGNYNIYGQRLLAGGSLTGTNFSIVSNSADERYPAVAGNGSGQFLVAWQREVSSSDFDIRAFRIEAATGQTLDGSQLGIDTGASKTRYPAVTASGSGGYQVLWQDQASSGAIIETRSVATDGSLGSISTMSDTTTGNRQSPAVGWNGSQVLGVWTDTGPAAQALIVGRWLGSSENIYISPFYSRRERTDLTYSPASQQYLLTWQQAAAAPEPDIFVQRVDDQGQAVGDPFNLTDHPAGQDKAVVAAGSSGSLVVWRDWRNESTTERDLYGQRLDTGGDPVGGLITITLASDYQSNPAIAYNSVRDEYLVVWDDNRDPGNLDIYGQIVQADGSLGAGFGLTVSGRQAYPDVAYNPADDTYLVVWEDARPGATSHDIYGQVISGSGALQGSDFVVATAANNQYDAVVAYGPTSGRYLVGWWDKRNDNWDIYGQLVSGSGVLSGSNFAISNPGSGSNNDQEYPAIAVQPVGATDEFLLVWQDRRNDWDRDIYGQRVDAEGQLLETNATDNVVIDSDTERYSENPVVAYNPDRADYLIAWNNYRPDGGVYVRRYSRATPATATASFTLDPTSGVVPLTLTVTDTSTGTIASRTWDFGDGTPPDPPATGGNGVVSHTYLTTGTFTVLLTVTNPGGSDIASQVITVTEQITPNLSADFEAIDLGVDPNFWLDQLYDTTGRDDFETLWADDSRALGTTYESGTVYSTYAIPGWAVWQNYDYSGRLKLSDPAGGIGLAFYSRYPAGAEQAYVLRRDGSVAGREAFHLVNFGVGDELNGDLDLGVIPQANAWYRFRVQATTLSDRVTFRAKVWPEGETEPAGWQAVAEDAGAGRVTAGAVAVRTEGPGAKYFDDLTVTPLTIQAGFSASPRTNFSPFQVTFSATPLGQVLTYTWDFGDGTPPQVTTGPTVTHTYDQVGVYSPSLTVAGPQGQDTMLRPAYIAANSLETDLRGYWPLEESSGTRFDGSSYGNDLSPNGTVGTATGQVGQAVDLNGSDAYLSRTHASQNGLAITNSLTLVGWMRPETVNAWQILAAKYEYGVNNRGYRFDLRPGNLLGFVVSPDGSNSNDFTLEATPAVTLTTGTWYHAAAVFDAAERQLRIYLDGSLIGVKAVNHNTIYNSTAPFMLGANLQSGSVTQHFDGQLDEWRVYARALSAEEINTLRVTSPPSVAFGASPVSGTAPLTVTFANSTTNATAYLWDFGDGTTSTQVNPSSVYTQAGVYTVSLSATGPGGSAVLTKANFITVTQPVTLAAGFYAFPLGGTAPLSVLFFDESSGNPTGYLWDFGDGSTSTQSSPTHTYTLPGVYTITQTVSNGVLTDTLTRANYIVVTGTVTADFSASPLSGTTPLTVTFANTSSGATSYAWDFGDGTGSTVVSPTHTYTQAGVYTVSLTATGSGGSDTLTRTNYITVTAPLAAGFYAFPLGGTAPLSVLFFDESSGNPTGYLWDFGDSITSTESYPSHTYTLPGVYTVTQTVSNGVLTDTLTRTNYITVTAPAVVAGFSATPLTGTVPLTVTFANSSTGATDYLWTFGTGASLSVISPTYTYAQPGVYTVTLTATGPGGSDTLTRTNYLTVTDELPAGLVLTNDSPTPLGQPTTLTATLTAGTNLSYTVAPGDGSTFISQSSTFSYTYPAAGEYTAVVTAGNSAGLITGTTAVTISGVASETLAISKRGPRLVLPGEPITYTLTVTNTGSVTATNLLITDTLPPGAGYLSGGTQVGNVISWTLANLAPLTSTTVQFAVTATQTITNSDYAVSAAGGLSAVGQAVVRTERLDFTAEPLTGTVPLTVTLVASPTGATGYSWNFGDGTITPQLPITNYQLPITTTHHYTQAGVYTVSLTALSAGNSLTLTRTHYITAVAPLALDFSASPLTGNAPLTVTLVASATGATGYTWDFGDAVTLAITNVTTNPLTTTHVYTQAGVYTVTLTAGNGVVSDTLTKTNYITVSPVITRDWQLITTTVSPPVLGEHVMAYDPSTSSGQGSGGTVVLYGGNATGWPYENTTYEFDGTDWLTVTVTTTPTARYGAEMAYLPGQGVILFGGSDESDTALNQTWVYTDGDWSQLPLTGTIPASRTYHSLVTTSPLAGGTEGGLYLFGGVNRDETQAYNDLWRYNGSEGWTEIVPSGDAPQARSLAALAYDTANERLLLFGGRTLTGTLLADLWAFDPSTNTWSELDDGGGGGGPLARMAHSLTYDPATGQTVLVGGVTDDGDTLLADTWHYTLPNGSPGGWSQADPAMPLPARAYHQAVYTGEAIILFSNAEVWGYE